MVALILLVTQPPIKLSQSLIITNYPHFESDWLPPYSTHSIVLLPFEDMEALWTRLIHRLQRTSFGILWYS